jgi:hypothetical protein
MEIESRPRPWLKWVPIAAFTVSTVSFFFSVFVLYPWHLELSLQFSGLEAQLKNRSVNN